MTFDGSSWIFLSGCSRGLGLELARSALATGYGVAACSKSTNAELEALSRTYGTRLFWMPTDLAEEKAIESFVSDACVHFAQASLWGVVNNAAISTEGILATLPVCDIEKVLQVNLTGTIILTRSALRRMIRQRAGGRIINISSITASRGYTGLSAYAASKAGMDGFSRALAREVGRLGITVNAVAPGYMRTALSANLSEHQLQQIVRRTPLGRLCELSDVVNLVEFLLSGKSSFITGQILTVDGGLTT